MRAPIYPHDLTNTAEKDYLYVTQNLIHSRKGYRKSIENKTERLKKKEKTYRQSSSVHKPLESLAKPASSGVDNTKTLKK